MAIKAIEIPTVLIERVEAAHPAPAYFGIDETDDWPAQVLAALLRQGVLTEADRATAIDCPGCEWHCQKRVVVRRADDVSRAFIVCDEVPQHGRVTIGLRNLRQFQTSLRSIGLVVAGAIKAGAPKVTHGGAGYALGHVKGRNGMRSVVVGIVDGQFVLGVGKHLVAISSILACRDAELVVDRGQIQRLADRKEETASQVVGHVSDRSRQKARTTSTRQRNQSILREAKKLHAEGGLSWTDVAASIAGSAVAPKLKADSVRRIVTALRGREQKESRPKPEKRKS